MGVGENRRQIVGHEFLDENRSVQILRGPTESLSPDREASVCGSISLSPCVCVCCLRVSGSESVTFPEKLSIYGIGAKIKKVETWNGPYS